MAEPAAIVCASCGAPTQAGQLTCDFCRAPLAVARCEACHVPNPPGAWFCSGCGRKLGPEPSRSSSSRQCPGCAGSMDRVESRAGECLDCASCGGQFLDHLRLRDLLEQALAIGEASPRPYTPSNPALERVRYRRCPICQQLMNRRNFGRSSGIIVDICTGHGTWFDSGELSRVIAFAESGALARARRDEAARERAAQRSLGAPALVSAPAPTSVIAPATALDVCLGLLGSLADVLDWLHGK